MTIDEIRKRLSVLQNQVNSLATLLPAHAQVEYRTVDYTGTDDIGERKRLLISVVAIAPDAANQLIQKLKGRP